MRQAIATRYLAYTNHREARVVAECWGARITVSFDSGKSVEENHWQAAQALIVKLGWNDRDGWQSHWVPGGNPAGTGNCYVYNDGDTLHLGKTAAKGLAVKRYVPAFEVWRGDMQLDIFFANHLEAQDWALQAFGMVDEEVNWHFVIKLDPGERDAWEADIQGDTFQIIRI